MAWRQCFLSNASWGGLGSLKLQLACFAKIPTGEMQERFPSMGRWWSWGNSQPRRIPLLISQQRRELTLWLAPDQIWGNQTPAREGDALSVSQGLGCSSPRLLGAPGLQVRVWLSSGAPTTRCLPASLWALCSCHQLGMFKC